MIIVNGKEMSWQAGMTISDILKKPMGTVATLLNRAKKKFNEEIKIQNIKI